MSPALEAAMTSPCPFLRALARHGLISPEREPLGALTRKVVAATDSGAGTKASASEILGIVLLGAAGSIGRLMRTIRQGLAIAELRRGPLDKLGGGSRVLDSLGHPDLAELQRMSTFAREFSGETGNPELGYDAEALERFMDANFSRPTQRRRWFDRQLMKGEWPALLQVMGKTHGPVPYLAHQDVVDMVTEARIPERVLSRIVNAT